MNIIRTAIDGVLILQPKVFGDARGFFMESFNQQRFDEAVGRPTAFVQDNHSRSTKGVLRGLHYQLAPHAQGKLVRVTRGSVFDVAVDLRPGSPTFGRWHGVELSAHNEREVFIPEGCAHGFQALSDDAQLLYQHTAPHSPACEAGLRYDDADLAIAWPLRISLVSERDRCHPLLSEIAVTQGVPA